MHIVWPSCTARESKGPQRTTTGAELQPEKGLEQEYLCVGDDGNDDSKSVNTLILEMESQKLLDRVTMLQFLINKGIFSRIKNESYPDSLFQRQ